MNRIQKDIEQKQGYVPTQPLRQFVTALFSEEAGGIPNRAERISGVRRERFYYALKTKPEFVQWYLEERAKMRSALGMMVDHALMRNIQCGDTTAIRTFYEMEGSIKREVKGGVGGQGGTLVQVVVKFPEESTPQSAPVVTPVDKVVNRVADKHLQPSSDTEKIVLA